MLQQSGWSEEHADNASKASVTWREDRINSLGRVTRSARSVRCRSLPPPPVLAGVKSGSWDAQTNTASGMSIGASGVRREA